MKKLRQEYASSSERHYRANSKPPVKRVVLCMGAGYDEVAMAEGDVQHQTIDYAKLQEALEQVSVKDDAALFSAIVNAPFGFKPEMALLFLGIIMLVLVDEKRGIVQAKAVAQTDFSENIDSMAVMPADAILIPLDAEDNLVVKAIKSGEPQASRDWSELMRPVVPDDQARFIQASGGVAVTAIHPLKDTPVNGALVYSFFRREAMDVDAQDDFMKRYTEQVSKVLKG